MFDLRGQGGVSEILRSDEDVAEMCAARARSTGIDGLDIIACGPKPSNPAELLSGPRLSDLLAWAEANYDQILLDCPPILAASDAVVVGRLTDGLILVVQPEKNHRRLVLRAVNGLAAVGLGIGGIVANRISSERNNGYYGYGGYGYGYGYGYGEAEEESSGEPICTSVSPESDCDEVDPAHGDQTKATAVVPRRAA
jgi:Mrp family chromosome partitioning ATPase